MIETIDHLAVSVKPVDGAVGAWKQPTASCRPGGGDNPRSLVAVLTLGHAVGPELLALGVQAKRVVLPQVDIRHRAAFAGLVAADVGGFGIGNASDITCNAAVILGLALGKTVDMKLGYLATYIDYSRGSGTSEFGLEGVLHGPLVGVTFRF